MERARTRPVLPIVVGFAGLLAVAAHSAPAPQPDPQPGSVTIAQFEQFLASASHSRDKNLAEKLAGFELTERTTGARLVEWQKQFTGRRTRQVLAALADLSAFEPLPAADLPSGPPPNIETQRILFSRVVDYVVATRPRLPNFSALRSTMRFEIATPDEIREEEQSAHLFRVRNEKVAYQALGRVHPGPGGGSWLYFAASSSRLVTYRDGHEVSDSPADEERRQPLPFRSQLSTVGEFGPILSVVVGDAVHGSVTWSHWEPGPDKPLAVFHYSVPENVSHYEVSTSPIEPPLYPAYHGEIAADPNTGAIFRLTLMADENNTEISDSGIVVDYGPVAIAGKTYICPVRSIALSRGPVNRNDRSVAIPDDMAQTFLNDVTFTGYHVFRSEMRILPDGAAGP